MEKRGKRRRKALPDGRKKRTFSFYHQVIDFFSSSHFLGHTRAIVVPFSPEESLDTKGGDQLVIIWYYGTLSSSTLGLKGKIKDESPSSSKCVALLARSLGRPVITRAREGFLIPSYDKRKLTDGRLPLGEGEMEESPFCLNSSKKFLSKQSKSKGTYS